VYVCTAEVLTYFPLVPDGRKSKMTRKPSKKVPAKPHRARKSKQLPVSPAVECQAEECRHYELIKQNLKQICEAQKLFQDIVRTIKRLKK